MDQMKLEERTTSRKSVAKIRLPVMYRTQASSTFQGSVVVAAWIFLRSYTRKTWPLFTSDEHASEE